MDHRKYYGNPQQIMGVEEHRLVGGKGDGMRLLQIRNGLGLDCTISVDRCADISRLIFKGDNLGYFSPAGYVAPSYYDDIGDGMLRSFTGGFLTTCGLTNVGVACEDQGEQLPLHGRISNQPAEHCYWTEDEKEIVIYAKISQAAMFLEKLTLTRKIVIKKDCNLIRIEDVIQNCGEYETPCMILYHMNMGYPLLSEQSILQIPSVSITPRTEHAKEQLDSWNQITPPAPNVEEACFYHTFDKKGFARIYNPVIKKGVEISFDPTNLDCFTQWNMFGEYDYVLGLEPGNCRPDGRHKTRQDRRLKTLKCNESKKYWVEIKIVEE
ncbi:MAG: DUF4432 domain-containing protein [Clostridium sp.]|jgi:hypothetical protein